MKKLFAVLALAGVMASCNNKKKDEDKKPEGDDTTTQVTTPPADDKPADNSGAPTFSDPEVQQYASDYAAFVKSYIDAYKAKDMTKVSELAGKMQDWTKRSTDVSMKLATKPEEAKKFAEYMTKLSQDWADAAKAMMPEVK